MQRKGSFRSGTRHKLSKRPRDAGKVTISRLLRTFKVGDRVRILQESAVHTGMPHPKFKNNVGTVVRIQGKSYVIEVKDLNKSKEVISSAVHLKKVK